MLSVRAYGSTQVPFGIGGGGTLMTEREGSMDGRGVYDGWL